MKGKWNKLEDIIEKINNKEYMQKINKQSLDKEKVKQENALRHITAKEFKKLEQEKILENNAKRKEEAIRKLKEKREYFRRKNK